MAAIPRSSSAVKLWRTWKQPSACGLCHLESIPWSLVWGKCRGPWGERGAVWAWRGGWEAASVCPEEHSGYSQIACGPGDPRSPKVRLYPPEQRFGLCLFFRHVLLSPAASAGTLQAQEKGHSVSSRSRTGRGVGVGTILKKETLALTGRAKGAPGESAWPLAPGTDFPMEEEAASQAPLKCCPWWGAIPCGPCRVHLWRGGLQVSGSAPHRSLPVFPGVLVPTWRLAGQALWHSWEQSCCSHPVSSHRSRPGFGLPLFSWPVPSKFGGHFIDGAQRPK